MSDNVKLDAEFVWCAEWFVEHGRLAHDMFGIVGP